MGKNNELRETIAALETRKGLGMMSGPKLVLPDEYLLRIVSKVLHQTTKNYDWDKSVNRRYRAHRHEAEDVDIFINRVKKELGVERFPSGVKDRVCEMGAGMEGKVRARQKLAEREDPKTTRELAIERGTFRRVRDAMWHLRWHDKLVRAAGGSSVIVAWLERGYRYDRTQMVESNVERGTASWESTGQVDLKGIIKVDVRKSWYGRVARRGIATVGDAFVYDAPPVYEDEAIAVGRECAGQWPVCHLVDVAYRKVGFRIAEEKRWVEIGCGDPKFVKTGR